MSSSCYDFLNKEIQPLWVWPQNQSLDLNQYVDFRHEFKIEEVENDSELLISSDSNYIVWINGIFLGSGQYQSFPGKQYYDLLPIGKYLRKGKNALAIRGIWYGESNFSYINDSPGLLYAITKQTAVLSGSDTMYRKTRSYRQGPMPRITFQMAFTFEYDARKEDDWVEPSYISDETWECISISEQKSCDYKGELLHRPIKNLVTKHRVNPVIIAQGLFKRCIKSASTVAELMQTDYLSARHITEIFKGVDERLTPVRLDNVVHVNTEVVDADGVYVLFDMGREECGYFNIEVEASDGTIIDLAIGEHLDDLRVRAAVGGRNFSSRYICREGFQEFTHYTNRWAGRFLQLHISELGKHFNIHYAGCKPVEYPVEIQGEFSSPDKLQVKVYDIAVRTLYLCMHEHYEDTPWREQALYANDSRNQAICGYYCFGPSEFAKASFQLLADGLRDDGYLEMCGPSRYKVTIPSFTMTWFLAIADNLRFTGDRDFAEAIYPTARKMVGKYIDSMIDGLLPSPQGDRHWHFYDWADGLDGTETTENGSNLLVLDRLRFDAPLNMFFCIVLKSMEFIANNCSDGQFARQCENIYEDLITSSHKSFWDPDKGFYKTYMGDDSPEHYCEQTQALAICSGVSSGNVSDMLRERLILDDKKLVRASLSQSFYKYEALLQDKQKYGSWCFENIGSRWGAMAYSGATSFWETERGSWDFSNAGSLSHGWSAIPIYFCYAYLLGIKPVEPGFKTFVVSPVNGIVDKISGKVPTPYGIIEIEWVSGNKKNVCHIRCPAAITPIAIDEQVEMIVNKI